ncbi:hypothetical protein FG379_000142 [Cryptosporidium bovis]|uniref:uncharacterized protein n=1 Tax=Cryptosporidium bovis TaxID=310047 RepID=UPI00351A6EDE|nr:hypothetical protein FG379_000142 [Cryptosporidium bovis]
MTLRVTGLLFVVFSTISLFKVNNLYFCDGHLEGNERNLQENREQLSVIADDYENLKYSDFESEIGNHELRSILEGLSNGSLRKFPTYSEANKILDDIRDLFGTNYIRKFIIGKSYEKRDIVALQIGIFKNGKINDSINFNETISYETYSNLNSNEYSTGKPSFLLTSLHHSREPAGLTTGIYFISKLLDDFITKKNPHATYILSNTEIWFVPFINPDGYVEIELTKNYGIRKNRRKTCNSGNVQDDGVDINRNYDFMFDNNQTSKCDPQEYPGEYPFSEPETRAIRDLTIKIKTIKTAVNLHTFGDLWTIPWNCCKNKEFEDEISEIYNELKYEILVSSPSCIIRSIFQKKGNLFYNQYSSGFNTTFFTRYRKEFENLSRMCFSSAPKNPLMNYEASGEADDYLLGMHNIISLSPEIGSSYYGFYPPSIEIIPIASKYYPQILAIASKSLPEYSTTIKLEMMTPENDQANLEISLFNSGLSSSCSNQKTVRNDLCFSVIVWELISTNCNDHSTLSPGNVQVGKYSAGFRYRSSTGGNTLEEYFEGKSCSSSKLLTAINKDLYKDKGESLYRYANGFTFRNSIKSRVLKIFKLKFQYFGKNSRKKHAYTGGNIVFHTCVATLDRDSHDNLCHCGNIVLKEGVANSSSALLLHSTVSDNLCDQLYRNSGDSMVPANAVRFVEIHSEEFDIKTKSTLGNKFQLSNRSTIYISLCVASISLLSFAALLYAVIREK